ncbi:MAG: hypothetical protein ABS81_09010 [Pseudonocardia sp. SCN 72-86]|nr:MAG: hypothetical protein ABS81_09010 [Pseudonocardia sp. SCN 72-86]
MCSNETPLEPEGAPSAQTFTDRSELIAAIHPGMELCTSDFTAWADIQEVGSDGIRGAKRSDGTPVHVPANALLDIRGGHCVRVDRVRATIDAQGWEVGTPTA